MKPLPYLLTFLSAIAAALVLAGPAPAATITPEGDLRLGCIAKLSGVIEAGDAERLDAVLVELARSGAHAGFEINQDYLSWPEAGYAKFVNRPGYRVCLESPGGSFPAGIELGGYLDGVRVGTAVAAGERCLSACAVAFLGGANFGDSGRRNNRIMHATAAVGFHSPALRVPDDAYSRESVESAYATALQTMAVLLDEADTLRLRRSLIRTMLETPPSGFKMIDTVFDAARWGIGVVGTVYPDRISAMAMRNACAGLLDYTAAFGFDEPLADYPLEERRSPEEETRFVLGFAAENGRYEIFYDRRPIYEGDEVPCRIWVADSGFDVASEALGAYFPEYLYATAMNGQPVWPAYFFDPATRLADIARRDWRVMETARVAASAPDLSEGETTCHLFAGATARARDTCNFRLEQWVREDLSTSILAVFEWASGGETIFNVEAGNVVLDRRFYPVTFALNGQPAEPIPFARDQPIAGGFCFTPTAGGDTFCFDGHPDLARQLF